MPELQAIRERARRSLHLRMGRLAAYYENRTDQPDRFRIIRVRYHSGAEKTGVEGSGGYAQIQDRREKMIFLREDVPRPPRHALIVLSPTEGYFVDNADEPDGITISASVTKADPRDLKGRRDPRGDYIE